MTPDLVWLVLSGLAIVGLLWWFVGTRASFRPPEVFTPHCGTCGYRLSDRRAACSECGRDLAGRSIVSDRWVPGFRRLCRVVVVIGVFAVASAAMAPLHAVLPFGGINRQVRTEFRRLDASRTPMPLLTIEERSSWFGRIPAGTGPWGGGGPGAPSAARRSVSFWPGAFEVWADELTDDVPGTAAVTVDMLGDARTPAPDASGARRGLIFDDPGAEQTRELVLAALAGFDTGPGGVAPAALRDGVDLGLAGPGAVDAWIAGPPAIAGPGEIYLGIVTVPRRGTGLVDRRDFVVHPNAPEGTIVPVRRTVVARVWTLRGTLAPALLWCGAVAALAVGFIELRRWFAMRPRSKDHPSMPWSGDAT